MVDILRALYRNAATDGCEIAFADDEITVTWSELAEQVTAFSKDLRNSPPILGLYGHNDIDWVVALLAGWLAGKTIVPLPTHFSIAQLRHVVEDADIGEIVTTRSTCNFTAALDECIPTMSQRRGKSCPASVSRGGIIIYTSGSTGTPKGVRLGLDQVDWQANALSRLIQADKRDVHLSVLPLSLLLEIICGICVPVIAGAHTQLVTEMARSVGEGRVRKLDSLFRQQAATTTVLVPQLLSTWVVELEASGAHAPAGLRFVALGGAPVSKALAERAWRLGIPVHEGYGLSECCSVVAVNPPHRRKAGTVGVPLPGLDVQIEDGEIVVSGPTVMDGYLNGSSAGGCWRTGDLGHLDADGFLTVSGRKDNLLVTSFGRNISPEWIEMMLLSDPRLRACAVCGHGEPHLGVVLIPSAIGEAWFAGLSRTKVHNWIEQMSASAPPYAVPGDFVICTASKARETGLLTANGQIVRTAASRVYGEFRSTSRLGSTELQRQDQPQQQENPNVVL